MYRSRHQPLSAAGPSAALRIRALRWHPDVIDGSRAVHASGASVPEYKLQYFDHGRFERTEPLLAFDDPNAIAVARHLVRSMRAELWLGDRCVHRFNEDRLD
jgi:hypothetical protein